MIHPYFWVWWNYWFSGFVWPVFYRSRLHVEADWTNIVLKPIHVRCTESVEIWVENRQSNRQYPQSCGGFDPIWLWDKKRFLSVSTSMKPLSQNSTPRIHHLHLLPFVSIFAICYAFHNVFFYSRSDQSLTGAGYIVADWKSVEFILDAWKSEIWI